MPKRVIDFDAMWASDKLASCAEWAQTEYAWLYGLADASGSFEMTNLRVIWGRVAAIRRNLTLELLGQVFDEFIARGLLFTWEENGKRYGHWTGSDVPGRLPPPSWRMRLEKLAPPIPRAGLAAYSARFGGRREGMASGESKPLPPPVLLDSQVAGLKHEVEEAQAQDWDLGLDLDLKKEKQEVCPAPPLVMQAAAEMPTEACEYSPEALLEIYEAERGVLPPASGLTPERRRRCAHLLTAGFTPEEFRAAVQRAAETPFLAGAGDQRTAPCACICSRRGKPPRASRLILFRVYYLGRAEYRTALHQLGLSERTWSDWAEEVRGLVGSQLIRAGMYPPSRYFRQASTNGKRKAKMKPVQREQDFT